MSSWIILALLTTIIYVLLSIIKTKRNKHLKHLPTYPYLPILGNMHYLLGGPKKYFQRLLETSYIIEKANLPFTFWIGIHPAIVINDPDEAKIISNAFIEKTYVYKFPWIWLGNGLLTAPGYIWKKNIKSAGVMFTRENVNGYQEIFNTQAKNLVKKLKLQVGCAPFDIMYPLSVTTLESICQTVLGVPHISNNIATDEYCQAFGNTLDKLVKRGLNIFLHPEFIYKRTKAYKDLKKHVAVLHNLSDTVLEKRKQEQSAEENKYNANFHHEMPEFRPFIDILLNISKSDANLTEEQIKSEVNTIIGAGQETVAVSLFFTLLIIGTKPDVQEKLYNEMKEIFGDSTRDVQKEDLDRMVYCEAVIKESLRLYPPVPVMARRAEQDLKLKSCTIPKGATCAINALGSGRSRRLWGPDVLEFNPERFNGPTPPILAFSIGKRSCVGKRYAYSILKTILAYCIRELVFISEAEKLKLKIDITLRAYEGNLIQVKLRDRK